MILLGYEKDGSSCKNPLLGNNTSQLTYLQLFITMDPPLGTLAPHKDQVSTILFYCTVGTYIYMMSYPTHTCAARGKVISRSV